MSLISLPNLLTDGTTALGDQVYANDSAIVNDYNGNITDANIAAGANISDSKLAQITSTGKISGTALTSLASIPAGAGVIPLANVPASTGGACTGSFQGLKIVYTSATQVTVTANELWLANSGGSKVQVTAFSQVIAITSVGANGLEAGTTEGANTWYYIWVIRKSSDGTKAGLLSASATSPTLPSGYDQYALYGAVRNDNSSNFVPFTQYGRKYIYTTWQNIATGNGSTTPWASITISAYVPSALSTLTFGTLAVLAGKGASITNNGSLTADLSTLSPNKFMNAPSANSCEAWIFDILTANTLYWNGNDAGNIVYLEGFEITALT